MPQGGKKLSKAANPLAAKKKNNSGDAKLAAKRKSAAALKAASAKLTKDLRVLRVRCERNHKQHKPFVYFQKQTAAYNTDIERQLAERVVAANHKLSLLAPKKQ
eukprot:TRINITY_DN2817_c0_g1_i2.p2 TRINITY_DN2817_c0_g1~~TRINITY_DN2817_c0_g1_i2.p2  ORF type:complete len:111 (-),score=41.74 TRINITY_DN2817_c0_g1_i2:6-317(-)